MHLPVHQQAGFLFLLPVMFDTGTLHPELIFKAVRSSGSGGQHVNKVSSKVELYFHVSGSALLNDAQKRLLSEKLANKISKDGWLIIESQESRSQFSNRKIATAKFDAMIKKSLERKKVRIKSNPPPVANVKRLESKRKKAEKKRLRGNRFDD